MHWWVRPGLPLVDLLLSVKQEVFQQGEQFAIWLTVEFIVSAQSGLNFGGEQPIV